MMNLYHGSNVQIQEIDLTRSKKGRDFGRGFYLNANRQQAFEMAQRTTWRMGWGEPILNSYIFDETNLSNPELKIKIFDTYTPEWAEFIIKNRNNKSDEQCHPYDIVIGPIADDTVGVQIYKYIRGQISVEKLIEELRFKGSHAIQYFFATQKALKYLTPIKK